MKRSAWPWIGVASVGAWLLFRSRRSVLGSPIEVDGMATVTRHGQFGAPRKGPPAHRHQGIDIAARPGSRVLAVGDGVIVGTNAGLGGIVRKLRLDQPASWMKGARRIDAVVYADLGKALVRPGDRVRAGTPIALVASAGFVHFAVKEARPSGEVFFDPKEAGFAYRLSDPRVS